MDKEVAKKKITNAINLYIKTFPDEFEAFKKSVQVKQDLTGEQRGWQTHSDTLERHLFDIPETLYMSLKRDLTNEEYNWLYGRTEDKTGLKWFMQTFKPFLIAEEY